MGAGGIRAVCVDLVGAVVEAGIGGLELERAGDRAVLVHLVRIRDADSTALFRLIQGNVLLQRSYIRDQIRRAVPVCSR